MVRFILIDGHAILHRAFHALPPLTTSGGRKVGAVFGFCSMLLRVIADSKPEYLAVAFDLPAPTFRQKLYKPYQAQRPEMAEELAGQIETVHKVLQTMEIPIFEVEGYEADDVIGTLTTKVLAGPAARHLVGARSANPPAGGLRANKVSGSRHPQGLEVVIVTGDRDMLQLVNDHVKVLAPIKGITQMILYNKEKVEEKYSLSPSQWVDFKALVGDPSDNYPGAAGIGPKTATALLKKFGSLEKIYQNLNQLSSKQAQVLEEGRERVQMAKKLATIVTDTPVELDFERCKLKDLKNPQVKKLFAELEFKSLWERLIKNNNPSPKPEKKEKEEEKNNNQLSLLN